MNDTFDFERDHPELYAEVQADKARRKRVSMLTFLISITISFAVCGVLLYSNINDLVCLLIVAWVSFSTVFPVRMTLERYIK